MGEIYSHINIDKNKLTQDFYVKMDTGEDCKYSIDYNPEYVINMDFLGQGNNRTNKCGWLRDKNYFFKNLLKEHPEIFSEENKIAISEGEQPLVDNKFIDYFPEYVDFIGDELIHHHIGEDGQAVALPVSIHRGYGIVHNAEKEIGVTEAGRQFSQEVQKDFEKGVTFSWDKAGVIIERCIAQNRPIDKEPNKESSNQNRPIDKETNKERTNQIDKETNKERTNKKRTNKNSWQKQAKKDNIFTKVYNFAMKKADERGFETVGEMVKTYALKATITIAKDIAVAVVEERIQRQTDKLNGEKGNSPNSYDYSTEDTPNPKAKEEKSKTSNDTSNIKNTANEMIQTSNATHASPSEHNVKGHGQHYNTREGRIWKEKDSFKRGKKDGGK